MCGERPSHETDVKKRKKERKSLLVRHKILAEVQPHTYSKLNLGIALIITVTL